MKLKSGQNKLFRGLNGQRKEEKGTCRSHLKKKKQLTNIIEEFEQKETDRTQAQRDLFLFSSTYFFLRFTEI